MEKTPRVKSSRSVTMAIRTLPEVEALVLADAAAEELPRSLIGHRIFVEHYRARGLLPARGAEAVATVARG